MGQEVPYSYIIHNTCGPRRILIWIFITRESCDTEYFLYRTVRWYNFKGRYPKVRGGFLENSHSLLQRSTAACDHFSKRKLTLENPAVNTTSMAAMAMVPREINIAEDFFKKVL